MAFLFECAELIVMGDATEDELDGDGIVSRLVTAGKSLCEWLHDEESFHAIECFAP
jgi:hypothetical protein